MSCDLVVMSCSPAQVTQLAPADDQAALLRRKTRRLIESFSPDGSAVLVELVCSQDPRWRTEITGSLQAWGAPEINVGSGHYLAEILARQILGDGARILSVRDEIGRLNPDAVTVVVVDGSAAMTPRAPLGLAQEASALDEHLRQLLGGHELAMDDSQLRRAGVIEPKLWMELARLEVVQAALIHADYESGVGRYLAQWSIDGG